MDSKMTAVAQSCAAGVDSGELTFPKWSVILAEAGFESVLFDFRRGTTIYYLPDGESLELPSPNRRGAVSWAFDAAAIKALIDEGRQALTADGGLAPGYSYEDNFPKLWAAGCAGSMISFPGRLTFYFGRTGETHVEPFPPLK